MAVQPSSLPRNPGTVTQPGDTEGTHRRVVTIHSNNRLGDQAAWEPPVRPLSVWVVACSVDF